MANETTIRPLSETRRVLFEGPASNEENKRRTLSECLRKVAAYVEERKLEDNQIDGFDLNFERVVDPDEGDYQGGYRWGAVLSHEPLREG